MDKMRQTMEKGDIQETILSLKETLDQAAKNSIPGFIPHKKRKLKNRTAPFNPEILQAAKLSKQTWWKWRMDGGPTSTLNPLTKNMKAAKYNLRRIQRQEAAKRRQDNMVKIMESKTSDNKTFYKLIAAQRSKEKSTVNCLVYNGKELTTTENITDGWADHFQSLANPLDNPGFDDGYLHQAETICEEIETYIRKQSCSPRLIEIGEVRSAVRKLNNNKALDIFGLSAEHLKKGGNQLLLLLCELLNSLLIAGKVPEILKKGIISPVFKKGDSNNPGNYRGITVTPVLLKLFEHVLNNRHKEIFKPSQFKLQTGFSEGTSCTNSALIISECQNEAKAMKLPLFFTTLDTRKAFDVVNHKILLRNLFLDGITNWEWLLLKDMYEEATSVVKWEGLLSSAINLKQGVRQGGVLSTEHYKRYNNPLLTDIEEKFSGAKIGNIKIPHTTCADDLALLSHHSWEMDEMLKEVGNFSARHRYEINPSKSSCIPLNNPSKCFPDNLKLNGEPIPIETVTTHLGLSRTSKGNVKIEEKLTCGRKTVYSLLGAGLHGKTGLNQSIKGHIWTTFVTPRITFGIEALPYSKMDLNKLDAFQVKSLKQIQYLPDRTSNSAALALLGIPPLSVTIHKNTINLLYRVLQSKDSIEHSIAERQLAVKTPDDKSFFSTCRNLLAKYGLPTAYEIHGNQLDKNIWKNILQSAINSYTENLWAEDIVQKPTLKYLNPYSVKVGKAHHIYSSVNCNIQDIKKAEIKARLLTGTYTLQANRSAFNQYKVNPTCKLCNSEPETREHFIGNCPSTENIRDSYKSKLKKVISPAYEQKTEELLNNPILLTHLTLDCTHPALGEVKLDQSLVKQIEDLSRHFIWKLHRIRSEQLSQHAL